MIVPDWRELANICSVLRVFESHSCQMILKNLVYMQVLGVLILIGLPRKELALHLLTR
jgi:hypothetical protein